MPARVDEEPSEHDRLQRRLDVSVCIRGGRWRVVACALLGLLALLLASGCGSSTSSSKGPQTRTVQIDGSSSAFHAGFMGYFPKAVIVHAGDTGAFHENWSGEPHSVTMGTLAEKGLAAAARANPNRPPPPA